MEWNIDKQTLLKASDTDDVLESKYFKTVIPGVVYFLEICPNGFNDETRGEVWVFLFLEENNKRIQATWSISNASACFKDHTDWIYELGGLDGYGSKICTCSDLFDPEKKFIEHGKLTLKLDGTLKTLDVIKQNPTVEISSLSELLFIREDKDFVIAVGEDEVKVILIMGFEVVLMFLFLGPQMDTRSSFACF